MKDTEAAKRMTLREFPGAVPKEHVDLLADAKRLTGLEPVLRDVSQREPEFDRVSGMAARILDVPVCVLSYVTTDRQIFKTAQGLNPEMDARRQTPLSHSFCQYVVTQNAPLAVNDSRQHPVLASNGAVDDLRVIAYLGYPVQDASGVVLGAFAAISDTPRVWTQADVAMMADLASIIERELQLRAEIEKRQLLMKELNHRAKNLFTVVLGLLRMSSRYVASPAELAEQMTDRITALSKAHELAVQVEPGKGGHSLTFRRLVEMILQPYLGSVQTTVTVDAHDDLVAPEAVTYLALALHELATNAVKYGALAHDGASLTITAGPPVGDHYTVTWEEDVPGGGYVESGAEGFGSVLLRNAVTRAMRGSTTLDQVGTLRTQTLTLPVDHFIRMT